ncbi:DUF4974 domain-containing protein [Sphingobacterium sp. DK4209]|uniref:DUF4974 domain-containing protein n=1 Tax=Sphingobacterium zhuxiongii TaxID=2662364 RepID=A0A5Q0QEH0_9SPHI|nr:MULTISPECIES: FecR family protein [unclassified Sphingobacterium]MVZ67008.1 DUF4974 domain-containing protein [Sphingobacterium sp. DK4209]QGA25932.1 DUF4974 domain-containing protein [Sphingobacterium sp. dk4302]
MEQPILRTIINILSGRQGKDDLDKVDQQLAESFERNEWNDDNDAQENVHDRISKAVLSKTNPPVNFKKNNYSIILKIAATILFLGIVGYQAAKYDIVNIGLFSKGHNFKSASAGLSTSNGDFKDLKLMSIGETYEQQSFSIVKVSENKYEFRSKEHNGDLTQIRVATDVMESFQLQLPDLSIVTLDSQSELIFPSKFKSNSRQVEAKGRLYFQVVKDPSRPFSVESNHITALVKGTSFVFNSNNKIEDTFIALVEGSLACVHNQSNILLKPGQKGALQNDNLTIGSFDLEEMLAFTRNEFLFQNQSLQVIMNEISSWYHMVPDLSGLESNELILTLKINRNKSLREVLDILQLTGDLNIKIEERRIIVRKANH